jgi:hypothetical protein
MKTKKMTLFLLLTIVTGLAYGQFKKTVIAPTIAAQKKIMLNPIKSHKQMTELSGQVLHDTEKYWNRNFKHLEKKHELPEELRKIKEEKILLKKQNLKETYPNQEQVNKISSVTPVVGTNFAGNWYDGGFPPDNSIAISNGGYIVSTVNSSIEYYNTSGTLLYTSSFYDFFNDATLTSSIYDPVVLYDSGADRFFMVVLHGNSSSTSKVITCFSKTNNPSDGWWVYKLTGNPLSDGSWFDYPKIGVSNNEVYVTGNLYYDVGGNNESVIYQITKSDGYSGGSFSWQYWYGISEDPFTLVPASFGHQGNYGPGIYLVSTDENSIFTDKYRFYNLTDDMSGSPSLDVYSIDADFSSAANAFQFGSSVELDNGSNRGLSAFYLNGIFHFVFHSEYTNYYNGINYNRIDVSALTNTSRKFGLDGYDYSFPSIASFSTSTSDKSVMICFLRSSSTIYPELRAVNCDNNGNWSSSIIVKSGLSYVDNGNVAETRWGDYTGISRKHNANSSEVWLGGQYGTTRFISGFGTSHCFETWIAQINDGSPSGIEDNHETSDKIDVFPNPVYDMFKLEFYLDENLPIEISIIDINGRLVKLLYKDAAKQGRNLLSFNKGALKNGTYFVKINSNQNIIQNEKIIIQ